MCVCVCVKRRHLWGEGWDVLTPVFSPRKTNVFFSLSCSSLTQKRNKKITNTLRPCALLVWYVWCSKKWGGAGGR